MLIDASPAQNSDALVSARGKFGVGPVPDWVTSCLPDYDFKPQPSKTPGSTTLLLWSVQTHAEKNATHVHMAYRLENMEAVQQMSQWRVEFEPRTQNITLHWIKTRRGTTEFDHTQLHKLHLLQREAGLEGCVIDGMFTALLLLEDVRSGDVLEWCYTSEARPRFLPENHFALFRLPGAVPMGRAFFATGGRSTCCRSTPRFTGPTACTGTRATRSRRMASRS
jgi:hypothetical protein